MVLGIYCAGGLGSEVIDLAKEINEAQNRWEYICYINDVAPAIEVEDDVLSFDSFQEKYPSNHAEILIASGEPEGRRKLFKRVADAGYILPNLIHPSSTVRGIKVIGCGNIVQDYVSFSPSNVIIGNNNVFMPFTRISHDCSIGNHCVFASSANASGNVTIEDCCYIGARASLRERITIHKRSVIGMGAAVLKDVEAKSVMVGIPARLLRKNAGMVFRKNTIYQQKTKGEDANEK